MTWLRMLLLGGTMLFTLTMVARGNASECVMIGEWNDLVISINTATDSLTLCQFDIDKTASSKRIVLQKQLNISCFGATETEKCTIRGPGRHFYIGGSAAEIVLDGFAFHGASECAVLVLSTANKTQVVKNCDFVGNEGDFSSWRGGAIKTALETSLVVSACKFIGNKAEEGGAIFHNGKNLTIRNSSFRDNVAKEGGAISGASFAFFEVHVSSFVNNSATRMGGAIRVKDPLTLTKSSNVVGSDNVPCNGVHDVTNDYCDEFSTPTLAPKPYVTTFCLVADAPYDERQRRKLLQQVESMSDACEFVAHLGDIRSARNFDTCVRETYTNASLVMSRSPKAVFMTLGDNEWNDCPNHQQALGYWHDEFDGFLEDNWPEHSFEVISQPQRIENVYFVHKQTLFICLTIVGGRVQDQNEWDTRLTANFVWTRNLIERHVKIENDAYAVVIMAHATNSPSNRKFFYAMRDYIRDELRNTIPILYLNGDAHSWNYEPNYFGEPSWLRITLTGGTDEPPLKVMVDGSSNVSSVYEAFSYDWGL